MSPGFTLRCLSHLQYTYWFHWSYRHDSACSWRYQYITEPVCFFCDIARLRLIPRNLSSLSLTGTIPQTIANIVSLLTLYVNSAPLICSRWRDLSKNQLSGLIPSDIYQCTYLNFMYVCSRLFSFLFLTIRDVSQNLFAGQLPDMSSLPIARLYV